MRVNHVMDDPAEQEHYVIAACYPLVCRNKSTQSIYIDAVLDRIGSYRLDVTLPDEARARIREIIQSRDRDRVGLELDATLARFEPPTQERPQLQVTFEHWLNKGVAALRQGDDDFVGFLKEFDRWMVAQSQRSSDDSTRTFLNMFAYEAKAAFYLCYANAWIDLIPWLKEQRGLDLVSERFLRFWQYQNQPSTGQDGRIRRDVFSGQVLALHPLSGFFMKDEALCAVAGRFFASSEHDTIMQTGKADDDPTYWDFVGALLNAGNSIGWPAINWRTGEARAAILEH